MKKRWLFLAALIVSAPHAAYAARQQTKISGAQTEAHVSGADTAQGGKNGTIHASGAATSAAGKTSSATGKKASDAGKVVDAIGRAAFAKDAGKNAPRHSSTVTHEFSDDHPAPGVVRQPRQPKQAAVEPPRSPDQPRSPDIPKLK